jgi:hypothetical protein
VLAPSSFMQAVRPGNPTPSDSRVRPVNSTPSDPLSGNGNEVPIIDTDVVARKASTPKGNKHAVSASGQNVAGAGVAALNAVVNTFADCAPVGN